MEKVKNDFYLLVDADDGTTLLPFELSQGCDPVNLLPTRIVTEDPWVTEPLGTLVVDGVSAPVKYDPETLPIHPDNTEYWGCLRADVSGNISVDLPAARSIREGMLQYPCECMEEPKRKEIIEKDALGDQNVSAVKAELAALINTRLGISAALDAIDTVSGIMNYAP